MLATEAAELINSVVYRPEWTFIAEPHTQRFEESVEVLVIYEARNSDKEEAPAYRNWVTGGARAGFVIMVADLTPDELMRKLITDVILRVEEHEAREFLRYPDTLVAPFHPHNAATMEAWGNPERDLTFGLA